VINKEAFCSSYNHIIASKNTIILSLPLYSFLSNYTAFCCVVINDSFALLACFISLENPDIITPKLTFFYRGVPASSVLSLSFTLLFLNLLYRPLPCNFNGNVGLVETGKEAVDSVGKRRGSIGVGSLREKAPSLLA
jgi:hypothetical protein